MKLIRFALIASVLALVANVFFVGAANAANKIVVSCTPPITRVTGIALLPTEIKDYSFWYKQPDPSTEIGPVKQPTCSYTLPIAEGVCIKKGTVFSATVFDTEGAESERGVSAPLASDACNPKSAPAAPVVTVTVQ